jgi:phytoene/squalene synthetase
MFAASGDICTALQLVNFWQDVRRDLVERDRIYLPLAECRLDEATLRAWMGGPTCPEFGRMLLPLVERTEA